MRRKLKDVKKHLELSDIKQLPGVTSGKCGFCGRGVIWVKLEDGHTGTSTLMLNPVPIRVFMKPDDLQEEPHWRLGYAGYISHSHTCKEMQ